MFIKIKDVMTKDVVTIREDSTIYDALTTLRDHNITGLPVVSEDRQLIGIVSEKDLLKLMYITKKSKPVVKEVMTKNVKCFDENDSLIDLAECLMKENFRRIPILSEKKLVGIVSRKDVIKILIEYRVSDK